MKNKNLIYGIVALLFLAGLSLFILNNYQIQIQAKPNKPIELPLQISGDCGIQNCHGLDIVCGPNAPQVCTMLYAAGDNCRQFASCQTLAGQCELAKTSKFDSCKSCVEKCKQDFQSDQIKFFGCESKCAE